MTTSTLRISTASSILLRSFILLSALLFCAPAKAEPSPQKSPSRALWLASAEVGFGPIDEDYFLHITPRLTFIHPAPLPFCKGAGCETLFEASLHAPLRLRVVDNTPLNPDFLRRRDWTELSDYLRILRRLEYGTPQDPFHLRLGELGPATLGNGSILRGYYNVITTDHHRPGLQAKATYDDYALELLTNNIISPNLWALRLSGRPDPIFDDHSWWRRFSLGLSLVADFTAPTELRRDHLQTIIVAPNYLPQVHKTEPAIVAGADLRWHILQKDSLIITPFADLNHHFGLGTGLHTGILWTQDFDEALQLSARLEYRLLTGRYTPDYFDPLYELTRYQYPSTKSPDLAGPKRRVLRTMTPATAHGGAGQVQARIAQLITLSAAFANAQGSIPANLRLRASADITDRARLGLFYYKFTSGHEEGFDQVTAELFNPKGSLVAAEGRAQIWGPIYALAQFARLWQLRDTGDFENLHLWVLGMGAATAF